MVGSCGCLELSSAVCSSDLWPLSFSSTAWRRARKASPVTRSSLCHSRHHWGTNTSLSTGARSCQASSGSAGATHSNQGKTLNGLTDMLVLFQWLPGRGSPTRTMTPPSNTTILFNGLNMLITPPASGHTGLPCRLFLWPTRPFLL